MSATLTIQVDYDEEAGVWVAECSEISLVTEADTFEILFRKLPDMIQDVLTDNADPRAGTDVRFELITHSHPRPRSRVA
ncbi:DUF1902 domain-containing protein [Rhodopseudomonas palustris]